MPDITSVIGPLGESIARFLELYGPLAALVGAFLLGEIAILVAFILAAQGLIPADTVFIFSVIGMLLADFFWYFFGVGTLHFLHQWNLYERASAPILNLLHRIVGKNLFLSLIFIKFLYGARLIVMVYLAVIKTPLRVFLVFDAIGVVIFVSVLFVIGWLAGQGIYNLLPAYHVLTGVVASVVVGGLIVYAVHALLKRFKRDLQ